VGQKVNPIGFRIGINRTWSSKWIAKRGKYKQLFLEDLKIREYTNARLGDADVADIEILRSPKEVTINLYTARPGVVIGQGGQRIEGFRHELELITGKNVQLNVLEVRYPETNAYLVARSLARQVVGRISHRRAMKRAISQAMRLGIQGIKIKASGRLGGHEIARKEEYKEGQIPLHTLRSKIDYAVADAKTSYGCIGFKVWIYKGQHYGGMRTYWDKIFEEERVKSRFRRPSSRGKG